MPRSTFDNVSFAQLKFLLDLLQTGKLTRTAENFGLSLSAASRTLEKLRAAFGDPLFSQHPRGLHPTHAMLRIEPELRKTLAQSDALFQPPEFNPARLRATFRVAARGLVVPDILAYVLPRIAKEAPGVQLDLTSRSDELWQQLELGIVDLAITIDRSVPPPLHTAELFCLELGLAVRRGHPLVAVAAERPLTVRDLQPYRRLAMTVSKDLRHASWDRQFLGESDAAQANVVAASTSPAELAATLEITDFLLLIPKRGTETLAKHYDVTWLPLPVDLQNRQPTTHGILVWHESRQRDPAHKWLRELFKDWARQTEKTDGGSEGENEVARPHRAL